MTKPYVRLDKDNAAVLLVDHQTGLLSRFSAIEEDEPLQWLLCNEYDLLKSV